jgi:hypothetical protein
MHRPATLSSIARLLQSPCATRCIEFMGGDFYCDGDVVTGKKYIADLRKLNFGTVFREENKPTTVCVGDSLYDRREDRRSPSDNDALSVEVGAPDTKGNVRAEHAVVLELEDYETGELVNFVADSPGSEAAIGRLCNVCARRRDNSVAVVLLSTWKHRNASGFPLKDPDLPVVACEPCYRSHDCDDDIPF